MDVKACDKCNTPLDGAGTCVTCEAAADGLELLGRSGYASVMEMLELLQREGVSAEIEQVPARRPEEKAHPLFNLYAPAAEVPSATAFLRKDWSAMLGDPGARAAAERGQLGVDLDAGVQIDCPACGHRFAPSRASPDCPECGLSLGAPAESAPDDAER
jgi:hypothetical protein